MCFCRCTLKCLVSNCTSECSNFRCPFSMTLKKMWLLLNLLIFILTCIKSAVPVLVCQVTLRMAVSFVKRHFLSMFCWCSFTTMHFVLLEPAQRRNTLTVFAMGSASSNHLGIPPGKGPNTVGSTDFMVDHTNQVGKFKILSFWLSV